MLISTALDRNIEKALAAVRNHPQHDLNLGYRQGIWAAFGSKDDSKTSDNSGHKRRATLAILVARYVLPIWDAIWSDDDTPHRLITTAEQVLNRTIDVKTARYYRDEVWTKLENLASEPEHQKPEYQKAINAGFAAINALSSALYDEEFDPDNINYNLTDADVDSYESDSSFWAAAAYSNGSIWEPNSDTTKRRKFWEWWLTEAVPKAWQALS